MAPQEPPKEAEKPVEQTPKSTDGIVKAPIEANSDKLPQGAVFTEVKSDTNRQVAPPAPIARSEPTVQNRPAIAPPKPAEPSPAPAPDAVHETPKPAQKSIKPGAQDSKPTAAIVVASAIFLLLVLAAYLAYAKSN